MTEGQIEKTGKSTSAQHPKEFIYEVSSNLVQGVVEKWLPTDGRTDEAATICSPFGEHKKGKSCDKKRFQQKTESIILLPLLHAWLLPDLNTIPDICVGENFL